MEHAGESYQLRQVVLLFSKALSNWMPSQLKLENTKEIQLVSVTTDYKQLKKLCPQSWSNLFKLSMASLSSLPGGGSLVLGFSNRSTEFPQWKEQHQEVMGFILFLQ